jgi:hypothetical protein
VCFRHSPRPPDLFSYRSETFDTNSAAEAVVEHLVTHRGLAIDRNAVPEPGKIVFVYRRKVPAGISGVSLATPSA